MTGQSPLESKMKFGIFLAPYSPAYKEGRRTIKEIIDWDMQLTQWADQYGQAEAWFSEHHTVFMEPCPAPELMIAAASQVTSRIMLGAAAHLLPYHNPIAVAHRMIWLDHMTGGRYIAGIAPGTAPLDAVVFGTGKNNNEMLIESMGIIDAILNKPRPFEIKGKYWSATMPAYDEAAGGPHLKPLQTPHPRFAMTGMQATSPTLKLAGDYGFMPLSQEVNTAALLEHWRVYTAAAEAAGHRADRSEWRIFRDFFVAETDQQARDIVVNGPAGETWDKFLLPAFRRLNLLHLVCGEGVDPEIVDVEWMADNFWLIGSPETVVEKARKLNADVGGCGGLISYTYDYSETPEVYETCFRLMQERVLPAFA
jgi:alkanesulfonate monooxygenase SsuD/methylene tetrahydromethanopterin reductase-like flavin-dependent oxidoreductase (luciferase family)